MKILLISNNYYPYFDGISIYTNNLYLNLKKNGHSVKWINFDKKFSKENLKFKDLFYTSTTKNSQYNIKKILNPYKVLNNDEGFRHYIFSNMIHRVVNKYIAGFKPDIIHITHERLSPVMFGLQIPIVVTAHGEEIKNNYSVNNYLERSSKIVCVSKFTYGLISKISNKYLVKAITINNSIDVDKFHIGNSRYNKKNYILSICRLSNEKNISTTIRAYSLLENKIKDKYKYYIIGDGPEKKSLIKLIESLNLTNNVFLLGNVTESIKIKYLKQSKIFLLCPKVKNTEQEGFGIAFLEAQASQIPILCSKVGGITEAVGNAGIYINDINDINEISSKLEDLIFNSKKQNNLIANGMKRIPKFDHKIWINSYINIYKILINI